MCEEQDDSLSVGQVDLEGGWLLTFWAAYILGSEIDDGGGFRISTGTSTVSGASLIRD